MAKDKSHQMDFRGLEILADEFTGDVSVEASSVTVAAITATNFSFAGGTLQEFAQAISDAIPAA